MQNDVNSVDIEELVGPLCVWRKISKPEAAENYSRSKKLSPDFDFTVCKGSVFYFAAFTGCSAPVAILLDEFYDLTYDGPNYSHEDNDWHYKFRITYR